MTPRLNSTAVAFMIAAPLAWAILLLFHGPGPTEGVYASLRDETDTWLAVHVGSVLGVGLLGAALYLLLRDVPGKAAQIGRLAIPPFALFYAAGEAIVGIATGVVVQEANDAPLRQRPALADAADALYNSFAGDLLIGIGTAAGVVAIIAAAVAYRRAGAPLGACVLLGLSAILVVHATPIGPIGLVCFAAAVALLAHSQRAATEAETPGLGASA